MRLAVEPLLVLKSSSEACERLSPTEAGPRCKLPMPAADVPLAAAAEGAAGAEPSRVPLAVAAALGAGCDGWAASKMPALRGSSAASRRELRSQPSSCLRCAAVNSSSRSHQAVRTAACAGPISRPCPVWLNTCSERRPFMMRTPALARSTLESAPVTAASRCGVGNAANARQLDGERQGEY